MTLRTSLQRLARRNPETLTLRERAAGLASGLVDAKKRAVLAAKVARVAYQPPAPEPAPVDRVALVNYASWLFMERRLVCAELYPHLGAGAYRFVRANNAADRFHYPDNPDIFPGVGPTPNLPSTRAIAVLDMVGVDWRADTDESGRAHNDPPSMRDTGARSETAFGWPRTDAELLEALDDLTRLDAALAAMHTGSDREGDRVPGYDALEDARSDALDRLAATRAESLIGLQAKARALLTRSVVDIAGAGDDIAESLARDLLGIPQSAIEPRPDPIHAALSELERREAACTAEWKRDRSEDGGPVRNAAQTAVFEHWRGVVLQTVPATARGCTALARFARAFHERWAASLDRDGPAVLDLIARSPLL